MKIKLLTLTVALFSLFSCNKSTFNVNVELQNTEDKMIYLKKMVDNEFVTLDSAIMQNNMVNFIVESGDPTNYYSITIKGVRYPINFFS